MKIKIKELEIEGSETLLSAFAEWLKAATPDASAETEVAEDPKKVNAERLILRVYGTLNPDAWERVLYTNDKEYKMLAREFEDARDIIDSLGSSLSQAQKEHEAKGLHEILKEYTRAVYAPDVRAAWAMLSWAYPDQDLRFGTAFLPNGDPPPCPFASAPQLVFAALGEDNYALSDRLERDLLGIGLRFATPSVFVGEAQGETVATSKGYAEYVDSLTEPTDVIRLSDIEAAQKAEKEAIQRAARLGFYWPLGGKSKKDLGEYAEAVYAWGAVYAGSALALNLRHRVGALLLSALGAYHFYSEAVSGYSGFLDNLEKGTISFGFFIGAKEAILEVGPRNALLCLGSEEFADRLLPSLEAALNDESSGPPLSKLSDSEVLALNEYRIPEGWEWLPALVGERRVHQIFGLEEPGRSNLLVNLRRQWEEAQKQ